jgi:proteasome accessory factor C
MHEQAKLQRVLKLIRLLLNGKYSITTLGYLLECSQSTVYKYFQLLEEVGYNIDKSSSGHYFIFAPNFLSNQFNQKELDLIQNLVSALPRTLEASTIRKKIGLDPVVPSSEYLSGVAALENLGLISEAISEKKWLNFEKYTSSNSNVISDRVIFPLEILLNGQIIGYDKSDEKTKTFKINRIGSISINYEGLSIPNLVLIDEQDMFGMSGCGDKIIKLLLTEQARNLLLEEYPNAVNMTQNYNDNHYHHTFTISVKDYAGIGRFILGLPGEIEVVSPIELIEYLKERALKSTFLDN